MLKILRISWYAVWTLNISCKRVIPSNKYIYQTFILPIYHFIFGKCLILFCHFSNFHRGKCLGVPQRDYGPDYDIPVYKK